LAGATAGAYRLKASRAASYIKEIRKGNFLDIYVDDGNIEKALKVLKRYIQREGVLKDVKRKSFYEKPSE
jgi:ribosomal protein S21